MATVTAETEISSNGGRQDSTEGKGEKSSTEVSSAPAVVRKTTAAIATVATTKSKSTLTAPKFDNLLEEEINLRRSVQGRSASLWFGSVHNDTNLHGGGDDNNNRTGLSSSSPFSSSPLELACSLCHVIWTSTVNLTSAILIFIFYLISIETALSIGLSIGLTVYTYNLARSEGEITTFDGSIMDWVLLSFAVVTPISASIGMAFTRRERALAEIANFKATAKNLYMAHASWDWCKAGQATTTGRVACTDVDWLGHNDRVMSLIFRMSSDLTRILMLPTSNRARHRVFCCGQQQRIRIEDLSRKLQRNIQYDMCILSSECEILKREGLPPNEATRIRQWERFIAERIEALLMIKRYRTPQALRSFARCFTVFLPPFYAPYYATMAVDLNSLGMALSFSIITSLALTSLFEAVVQLEDPFVGLRLDGINVERDLRDELLVELIDSRDFYFPDASKFEFDVKVPDIDDGPAIRLFNTT